MPRLSIENRQKLISLYYQYELHNVKGRYATLKEIAAEQNIYVGEVAVRKIMEKWFNTRLISNLPRKNGLTKITEYELNRLNRAVYKDRSVTSRKLKNLLNLQISHRSIRRYLNILGWKKVKSKYCQIVSLKNRLERIAFANNALKYNDTFMNSIFIDESTVQATKNAHQIWNKPFPNETRLGLISKFAHLESVNVIKGISRRGATPLIIFKSNFTKSLDLENN